MFPLGHSRWRHLILYSGVSHETWLVPSKGETQMYGCRMTLGPRRESNIGMTLLYQLLYTFFFSLISFQRTLQEKLWETKGEEEAWPKCNIFGGFLVYYFLMKTDLRKKCDFYNFFDCVGELLKSISG